jgi:hypothetical protein
MLAGMRRVTYIVVEINSNMDFSGSGTGYVR